MKINWSWGKRLRHVLAIGLILLLLYLLISIMYLAMSEFGRTMHVYRGEVPETCESKGVAKEIKETFQKDGPPLSRTVAMSATSAGLQLDLHLSVPYTHTLTRFATNGRLTQEVASFVCGTFGNIQTNQQELADNRWDTTWTLDSTTGRGDIHLWSRIPFPSYGVIIELTRAPVYPAAASVDDRVLVTIADFQLDYISPQPEQSTRQSALWTNGNGQEITFVVLPITSESGADVPLQEEPAQGGTRETIRGFLQRLHRSTGDMYPLSGLLFAVLEALPLFIFWYLVMRRRQSAPSLAASLTRTAVVLLLFHFIVIGLDTTVSIFYVFDENWLFGALSYFLPGNYLPLHAHSAVSIIVGVLLPALLWQKRVQPLRFRHLPAPWWRSIARVLWLVLLMAAAAVGTVFILNLQDYSDIFSRPLGSDPSPEWLLESLVWPFQPYELEMNFQIAWLLLLTSISALLVWVLLTILYFQFSLQRPRSGVIAAAVFLVVGVGIIEGYQLRYLDRRVDWGISLLELLIVTALSTSLVIAFGAVIYGQLKRIDQPHPVNLPKRWRLPAPSFLPPTDPSPPATAPQPTTSIPHWFQPLLQLVARIEAWLRPSNKQPPPLAKPKLPPEAPSAPSAPRAEPPPPLLMAWVLPRWGWTLLVLLVALFSIPMKGLFESPNLADMYDVVSMAYNIDNLMLLVWLAGVLWLLYMEGRETDPQLAPFARRAGILAASSLLFPPTAHWLYIPIRFLLGWYLLNQFIRPVMHWKTLQLFFTRVVIERGKLLDQIVDLNVAQSAYNQYRKSLTKKLNEGEETLTSYEEKLDTRKMELEQRWLDTQINQRPAKEVALTFGPYASAWQNGLHGAKWALLFATPWMFLFIRNFFGITIEYRIYPLWEFATEFLNVLVRWAGFGFVFGYFYPYLRGENGLQKGVGLFMVAVVPSLPLMLLDNATASQWQASLFWMLQVFTLCMLLGLLAFDYAVLRQGRYDWQMLFEVHGVTPIGVSVTSILVAMGTTVTTLLTTQATTLVTLALGFIIPETPQPLIPPSPIPGS